jgi:hypothetical protein
MGVVAGTRVKRRVRALRRALSVAVVDRILNVDTAEGVQLAHLGLEAPDRVSYEPGGWRDIRRVLRPSEVGTGDVFLDLGSGKGREVLAATRYRFGRVISVELSEQLDDDRPAQCRGLTAGAAHRHHRAGHG